MITKLWLCIGIQGWRVREEEYANEMQVEVTQSRKCLFVT